MELRCALSNETWPALATRGYGHSGSSGRGYVYRREPVVAVGFDAAGQGEKFVLNALGYRPARACANLDAIHRANRSDLHGCAAEENLLGYVKHFARNHLLGNRNS